MRGKRAREHGQEKMGETSKGRMRNSKKHIESKVGLESRRGKIKKWGNRDRSKETEDGDHAKDRLRLQDTK